MPRKTFSILNADGSCDENFQEIIPNSDLIKFLQVMIFNRVFDSRMLILQRQGRLGFYMTSFGEEAVTIGSAYVLKKTDPIFLTYRELGAILWRGVPKTRLLNQLIGNNQDFCKGRQMPVHYGFKDFYFPSISSPVGTQLPHACGYAFASKFKKTGDVSLTFLGEGTTSGQDFHVALNFAAVLHVPVVYVIRNNGYAISTPESKQFAAGNLANRAIGYGMPGIQIDGNDALIVIKTIGEAVENARQGLGPTLIEALTYRTGSHSSSDDPSLYRPPEESEEWKKVDAFERLSKHAQWRGIWSKEMTKEEDKKAQEEITGLIKETEKFPPPKVETVFDDVLETMPEALAEQKENYLKLIRNQ